MTEDRAPVACRHCGEDAADLLRREARVLGALDGWRRTCARCRRALLTAPTSTRSEDPRP